MKDSLRRTLWISRVTFLEAVRQRFFAFLLVLSAAMVLSSVSFRVFDFGHGELKFIADFGFGGMFFFGSVLAVVMTAQLFFSEIDNSAGRNSCWASSSAPGPCSASSSWSWPACKASSFGRANRS
jgi:hypothetical protein